MTDQLTADDLDMREALTNLQRDRIIIRIIAVLAAGLMVFFITLIALANAGVIQPNCDHLPLNNRIGQCYVAPAPEATSFAILPTPDPALYNLPSINLKQ